MDDIINYQKKDEEDFYIILGCNENSTEEQINAEFKARALGCHPDKHPNDESAHDEFSKISKAKDVLLDSEKRKDYDKWRNSGIAIPYDRWKSMSHVKTSMHWGHKTEQVALTNQNQPSTYHQFPDQNAQSSHSTTASQPNSNSSPSIPSMNFVKREQPKVNGWESDTSNPLLQKFRNYEI